MCTDYESTKVEVLKTRKGCVTASNNIDSRLSLLLKPKGFSSQSSVFGGTLKSTGQKTLISYLNFQMMK